MVLYNMTNSETLDMIFAELKVHILKLEPQQQAEYIEHLAEKLNQFNISYKLITY